ncbi:MAG: DNA-binding beta-propeller fold protein YncE [Pirellulaceae bacterium]|jgi:DNA-binding beta-propeller fold protein YncE
MRMPKPLFAITLLFATSTTALLALGQDQVSFEPDPSFPQLPKDFQLGACAAVAVGQDGTVFLFHRGEQPIVCLDSQGRFLRSWGDAEIVSAHGLRVDHNRHVWVTDMAGHRVLKYSGEGKLLLALGTGKPGANRDQFNKPTDIAFGSLGEFFVSDGYGNSRVTKFSPSGAVITTWGKRGKLHGEFNLPHSIIVDDKGRVLVGDRENNRIQIFDGDGKLLDVWNGFAPYGLAFSPKGELYVADGRADMVLRLDASGKVVQQIGKSGTAPGQFKMPHMLAFDQKGNLYVAEVGGKRVQKFVPK